jgi:CPA2 family monovalent cation:H+ antiporter-2
MFRSISRRHSHATGITGFLSGVELATFRVQPGSEVEGTLLRDGLLRERSGASVLVIRRGEEINSNPDPVWQFQAEDIVLVLGRAEQLAITTRLFEMTSIVHSR